MSAETATETGRTGAVEQEGKQLIEEARERGGEVGRQVQHEAGHAVSELRIRARQEADEQTHRAAGALRGVAHQLGSMAETTSEQGKVVDLAQQGAHQIERLAEHLDRDGMDGVVTDIQRFARRRPGLFLAAGFGVGMALGRLVRSSDMGQIRAAATGDTASRTGTESDSSSHPGGTGAGTAGAGLETVVDPVSGQRRIPDPDPTSRAKGDGNDWDRT
ncbi:hypothetical protein BH23ACT5_BH23ACT5_19910 [soil metagenome]